MATWNSGGSLAAFAAIATGDPALLLPGARAAVADADSYCDEASGSIELVMERDRWAQAGHVVLLAVEAACWSAIDAAAHTLEEGERAALVRAGPAFHLWDAITRIPIVFPGTNEPAIREQLRSALLP